MKEKKGGSRLLIWLAAIVMAIGGSVAPLPVYAKGEKASKTQTTKGSSSKKTTAGAREKKTVKAAPATGKSANAAKSGTAKKGTKAGSTKNKGVATKGTANKNVKKGSSKGTVKSGKAETSADVKRREAQTNKEIKETKQQIAANDKAIKRNVTELGKLETDITTTKAQVNATAVTVNRLNADLEILENNISANERELRLLREKYLKAVKQMRAKKNNKSTLAFIFSAKNFSQAMRRMRYLKEFREWRDQRSADISKKVAELKYQKELLAQTRVEQQNALARHQQVQTSLQAQYDRQDAIVVELKKNGEALNAHLASKQAEANALKNRIASLIAQEQAKAEADRRAEERRKAEAARKAEEEKKAAALKAEEEQRRRQQMADNQAKEEAKKPDKTAEKKNEKTETAAVKESASKKAATTESASNKTAASGKETARKKESEKKDDSYAQARKRKPRQSGAPAPAKSESSNKAAQPSSNATKSATAKPATTTASSGKSFESMRGALPRPVGGAFKVTSRFGRHALPDLPDVVYDNPGIDAEVSAGANAQAVFGGKVSGVYVVTGYSTVVIVNHGNYYTVYGNIVSPSVKTGDTIAQGQKLGKLATDPDNPNHSSIHFEVWRNREKLNPLDWIK